MISGKERYPENVFRNDEKITRITFQYDEVRNSYISPELYKPLYRPLPIHVPQVVTPSPVREWYQQERVAHLLAHPELTQPLYLDYVSAHRVEFFARTITSGERIARDMAASERVYTGRWYGQGDKPTCTPWSLVNACAVGGVEIDPGYITYLLNQAIKGEGYALACVNNSLKQSPVMAERVRLISLVPGLDRLVIKRALDENQPLIVSVITRLFYPQPNLNSPNGRHAICISGYQVTEEGYFNIQVIDSSNGIVWMSLEHLWPKTTEVYILTKTVS